MGWERRPNSRHRFYCRTFRRDGRIIREYLGAETDPIVRLIAEGDTLNRAEATAAVSGVRTEQAKYRELEPLLQALVSRVQELQEVNLLACGYRWRKGGLQVVKYRDSRSPQSDEDVKEEPLTQEVFEFLARRANRGDRQAAERLWQILRDHPKIWQEVGDLTKHAERALLKLIADGNPTLAESVRLRADELRKSLLAEATDTTLEQMLVNHVVACWLEVEYTRMATVQPQQFRHDARFWARKHDRANKRYLAAVKELSTLREAAARRVVPTVETTVGRSHEGCNAPEAMVD